MGSEAGIQFDRETSISHEREDIKQAQPKSI